MKVRILSRKKVDGKLYRELSCGHEQLEPQGGKSHLFTEAHCKTCGPEPTKAKKPRGPAVPKSKPETGAPVALKAPSKTKVEVRCGHPKQHEADFAHCKAKCLTCHQWVCGKCEGSNLRIGSRAVPCDRCWLSGEGTTTMVIRAPKPSPVVLVEPSLSLPPEIQPAV